MRSLRERSKQGTGLLSQTWHISCRVLIHAECLFWLYYDVLCRSVTYLSNWTNTRENEYSTQKVHLCSITTSPTKATSASNATDDQQDASADQVVLLNAVERRNAEKQGVWSLANKFTNLNCLLNLGTFLQSETTIHGTKSDLSLRSSLVQTPRRGPPWWQPWHRRHRPYLAGATGTACGRPPFRCFLQHCCTTSGVEWSCQYGSNWLNAKYLPLGYGSKSWSWTPGW